MLQFFHFKQMMREAGKWSSVREMKVKREVLRALEQPFQEALEQLPHVIKVTVITPLPHVIRVMVISVHHSPTSSG